ncbi:MAG: universal stress protein [Balneolaceae bacterium]|nr:MAG: universal stress protein [Balneolaceae bacterium]
MIKRILIALDLDDDTPIATQYAISMAKRFDASVTGLAVVDISNVYPTGIIGKPDATHYARNLWEELSEDSRQIANKLLENFQKSVEKAGVKYTAIQKEGASFERIIDGMKYHDLLILGRDSHFFYNEPARETKTLAQVVKRGVCPTLVVTDSFNDFKKILIAFDGSNPAARSLKSFIHLITDRDKAKIELLYVSDKKNPDEEPVLDYAETYLKEHGFKKIKKTVLLGPKPSDQILAHQKITGTQLTVLGAHAVSAIKRLSFGSTTHDLITSSRIPLFLSP